MEDEESLYLTQTDTTIGFISKSHHRLTKVKQRLPNKHYIEALPSLESLKESTRVPQQHKNRIRRAKRATFIFPNNHSYRVIKDTLHRGLLTKLKWAYTTSANLSGEEYDEEFARESADIVVGFPQSNRGRESSQIFKIGVGGIRRIR